MFCSGKFHYSAFFVTQALNCCKQFLGRATGAKKKIEEGGEIKNIKRQGMDEDRGIISRF